MADRAYLSDGPVTLRHYSDPLDLGCVLEREFPTIWLPILGAASVSLVQQCAELLLDDNNAWRDELTLPRDDLAGSLGMTGPTVQSPNSPFQKTLQRLNHFHFARVAITEDDDQVLSVRLSYPFVPFYKQQSKLPPHARVVYQRRCDLHDREAVEADA